jgi:nucleoside-diphosphate-sugar epimerase
MEWLMPSTRKGKALVTGATGFIGGNLVPLLQQTGYAVRVLVRDTARASRLDDVELFCGDLLDPASLAGIEEGIDVVVHGASLLGKWGTHPRLMYELNVGGALELLKRFQGRPLERYIHLSAGGVTGPLNTRSVDESYPCRPATAYERTKYEAEREVLELSRELAIPVTVVRPTFTYGPGDPHKIALFRAVKRGRYVFIGGGESVNHPVFIDDLVRGILLAIERGRVGEVYIIGGECPVTKRELVYAIADALGVGRPRINIPRWLASIAAWKLELAGHLLRFEPMLTRSRVMMMADNFGFSIAKARDELGYAPQTDLRRGIELTVRSYAQAGEL